MGFVKNKQVEFARVERLTFGGQDLAEQAHGSLFIFVGKNSVEFSGAQYLLTGPFELELYWPARVVRSSLYHAS
jgi:hypothetical protein